MQGAVVAQLVSDHATSEPASGAERRLGEPALGWRGAVVWFGVNGLSPVSLLQVKSGVAAGFGARA